MKASYIILLIVIAVAVAIIFSSTGSASEYVDFAQAENLAQDGDNEMVHVVGSLVKDASGQYVGMNYNPGIDPNHFEFMLKDTKGLEKKVVYFQPKPQDFEKAEQIVIIGHAKAGVFVANKILMKCPSKYEDKEIKI